MRFIVAIVSFVVAFLMISYGIAQRTVLATPDHVAATTELSTTAAVSVIDGAVLNTNDGRQKIVVSGSESIFAAYGRTADVLAWIGETTYNNIGIDAKTSELVNDIVRGTESEVPDPRGSDLWLGEYSRDTELSFVTNVPEGISLVLISDGIQPAPGRVSITWPVDNRTPWSGPLIVGGMLLLLAGLGLYLWALSHLRKARGPRRKPPKMPRAPRPSKPQKRLKYAPPKQKELAPTRGRRSSGRMAAISILLTGTLALTGCTAESWPEFLGGSPEVMPVPSPTETAAPVVVGKPPAVSVTQLESIVSKVAAVAQKADTDRDAALLETRFDGPALEMRKANYAIRKADNSYAPLPAIPSGPVEITLPQQNDRWPRTVFAVIQNPEDTTIVPTALFLVQQTPRENYKVVYAMQLEAKVVLPALAAASVGTQRLKPDARLFTLRPDELALDYGDIVLKGEESEFFDEFDTENDSLLASIGFEAKQRRKASIPGIAKMVFDIAPGAGDVIPLVTNDNGAIVAVYLNETETVRPVEAGAVINAEGAVKSLSKVSSTTKGTIATYGDQLLFYLPPSTSKKKIVLLGWASALIAAKEY